MSPGILLRSATTRTSNSCSYRRLKDITKPNQTKRPAKNLLPCSTSNWLRRALNTKSGKRRRTLPESSPALGLQIAQKGVTSIDCLGPTVGPTVPARYTLGHNVGPICDAHMKYFWPQSYQYSYTWSPRAWAPLKMPRVQRAPST